MNVRLLVLPTVWTILLDAVAWAIIQLGIARVSVMLPAETVRRASGFLRTRRWERDGAVYERLGVRRWKAWLPSGGPLFRDGFPLSRIASRDPDYLRTWSLESYRAELCHWLAILPAPLFFLWNLPVVGLAMILYAVGINLPCLIAQRYNRPRLERILKRL